MRRRDEEREREIEGTGREKRRGERREGGERGRRRDSEGR